MWLGVDLENGYQKDTSLIEIGLGDQNMVPIIDSIVNIIEERCMTTS